MRAALLIVAVTVVSFVFGFFAAGIESTVTEVQRQQEPLPTRAAPESWRLDRLSPGHSMHVINHGLECNDCHNPLELTFENVDFGVCTACHQEQAALTHTEVDGKPTDCVTCHAFKSDGHAFGAWDCARCHGSFDTPTHEGLAMHTSIACAQCHHPHHPIEDTVLDCQGCHQGIDVHHGRQAESSACANCHAGHDRAIDAASCMQCHATNEPVVSLAATFTGGHDSCATCHRAHSFSAVTAVGCRSCHEGTVTLAQRQTRAHADCMNCHSPHSVRSASEAACVRCHSEVSPTHPSVEGRGDCMTCHEPHPERSAEIALSCTHCHEEALSERAFHSPKTTCTDCHRPHGFDLGHLEEQAVCVRCHAPQVRLTGRLPGHARCQSCHQGTAHHLEAPVECTTCHADIHARSPQGHQECASCHEPHRGDLMLAQARCVTCHEYRTLPGLHRLPLEQGSEGHTECIACHSVHAKRARADRHTCMSCHQDLGDHEPKAKRCTGCHTFTSGR